MAFLDGSSAKALNDPMSSEWIADLIQLNSCCTVVTVRIHFVFRLHIASNQQAVVGKVVIFSDLQNRRRSISSANKLSRQL
jgi:hypothetical protein